MTRTESPTASQPRLPAPPDADTSSIALFLDLDGTLLDFAARPAGVCVEPKLRAALVRLHERLDGALAILSGRRLREIDALLDLGQLPAAGLHGAERRDGAGRTNLAAAGDTSVLEPVRQRAQALTAAIPGVFVEDKGQALAIHYRQAPDAALTIARIAQEMLSLAGKGYVLQPGNRVIEIKPAGSDKGSALATLMAVAPFSGRMPWMFGDDLTDEAAFACANALGGVSVIVGSRRPTAARCALADPGAARAWLQCLATAPGAAA